MQIQRVWLEIVFLTTALALVFALLFATLGVVAGASVLEEDGASQANQANRNQAFQGMVTCSRCGAKHSAALDHSATTCVRMCVHAGASFALVVDESTYLLEGRLGCLEEVRRSARTHRGHPVWKHDPSNVGICSRLSTPFFHKVMNERDPLSLVSRNSSDDRGPRRLGVGTRATTGSVSDCRDSTPTESGGASKRSDSSQHSIVLGR